MNVVIVGVVVVAALAVAWFLWGRSLELRRSALGVEVDKLEGVLEL